MEKLTLTALCAGLDTPRTRVERWISDGVFAPLDFPDRGKARGWTKHNAIRLACLLRLVDAGLRVEVGRSINRLDGWHLVSEPAFLVVLAHKRTVWEQRKRQDGTCELVDSGERYQAFLVKRSEIINQLREHSWVSIAHIIINLSDVENEVERAWVLAQSMPH